MYHGWHCRVEAAYLPRIVDSEIADGLASSGALVVRGARAVGKTESARRVARSELRLDSGDPRAMLARQQPKSALDGATPRLLDEWQLVPELWNEVRRAVDDRRLPGQFILSGSATPQEDARRHSGAGRFQQLMMRTMSFAESGESSGAVSLGRLLRGECAETAQSDADFRAVIRRLVVGGWPGWLGADEATARNRTQSYVEDISHHEFPQVAGSRRDPRRLTTHLRAVSALSAQPAGYAAIARRMQEEGNVSPSEATVPTLHELAERLFLVEDQPAWSPKLRSRSTAAQTPKRHLVDPSLAATLLGAGVSRLLIEPETLGFLFESQVIHDLRIYAQHANARGVFHYRDSKGRDEIDAVVEGEDGGWLAVEVKLGLPAVDAAAANLRRVCAKIVRPPVAMIVVIPTGVAHLRDDGVHVVPLTVLGP